MGARDGLSVGRKDVHERGDGRKLRDATLGARERLPMGHENVLVGGVARAP